MSTGLSDFPTDKEWIDELCHAKSTDSPIIPSQDPNEHRWGFLEPVNSNHPILHLPRDHDKYNIVPEDSSTNLMVVPWRDDHHPWVKLVKIQGLNNPSNWVFCIRTLFPNGDPKYRRFRDRDQLQFGDHVFMFHDTITLDGALLTYQYIQGCKVFTGGFGSVTKVALRTDPNVQVALKIVKTGHLIASGKLSTTYEISALKALNHPHVCRLVEIYATKGQDLHIIMEYAELANLAERVKTPQVFLNGASPLSVDVFAGSAIFQLCTAVQYIHSQGMMHRDIKPDNILFTSMHPLTLKVADFGQATREQRSKKQCGTRPYMAPEIMSQQDYDRRVDLYSVGLVVLDILLAMQGCENPVKAWKEKLNGREPNAQDIIDLRKDRNTCLQTDQTLLMADTRALSLAEGLLRQVPYTRISWETALNNAWLREMDSRRRIDPQTRFATPTQSANGSTAEAASVPSHEAPTVPREMTPAIQREVTPAISHRETTLVSPAPPVEVQTVGPEDIPSVAGAGAQLPVVVPVEVTVRDLQLKRRSSRIGKLARDKVGPYWLYRSGWERGMPRP